MERVGWSVVDVMRNEWNMQGRNACFPFGSLGKETMSNVAERTMPNSQTCTYPIRKLAQYGCFGIVNADEFAELTGGFTHGLHRSLQ
jgi:hypothetical protein